MKTIAILAITFLLNATLHADNHGKKDAEAAPFRHVVLFKFKDDATKEQVKALETGFSALPAKINTIVDYEWGTNVVANNRAESCFEGFNLLFDG